MPKKGDRVDTNSLTVEELFFFAFSFDRARPYVGMLVHGAENKDTRQRDKIVICWDMSEGRIHGAQSFQPMSEISGGHYLVFDRWLTKDESVTLHGHYEKRNGDK